MSQTDNGQRRDHRGRFTCGTKPGPGRPPKWRTGLTFKRALVKRVPPELWDEIVDQLVEAALGGNLQAIGVLCKILLDGAPSLREIAVLEAAGLDEGDQIGAEAMKLRVASQFVRLRAGLNDFFERFPVDGQMPVNDQPPTAEVNS